MYLLTKTIIRRDDDKYENNYRISAVIKLYTFN